VQAGLLKSPRNRKKVSKNSLQSKKCRRGITGEDLMDALSLTRERVGVWVSGPLPDTHTHWRTTRILIAEGSGEGDRRAFAAIGPGAFGETRTYTAGADAMGAADRTTDAPSPRAPLSSRIARASLARQRMLRCDSHSASPCARASARCKNPSRSSGMINRAAIRRHSSVD
jgi:hypothetical protein